MKKNNYLFLILLFLIGFETLNAQVYTTTVGFGQADLAIREVRRNALTGNVGWKSLTGFGVTYHNYLAKQMGVELGVGIALTNVKLGGRFSYFFSEKNFSPFVSGGFMYGLGFGDTEIEINSDGTYFKYKVSSSPYVQIAGGIEYLKKNGFLIKADIGYAILLTESNFEITDGFASNDQIQVLDTMLGSGFVMEVSIGYAFGKGK